MSHGSFSVITTLPDTTDPTASVLTEPSPQPVPHARKKSKGAHPTFHFLAGLFSGITSAALLQPVDLLKTRVQQSGHNQTVVQILRSILASPNPGAALWRGTLPSTLRTGFGSALYFTSLSSLRQVVANNSLPQSNDSRHGTTSSSVLPKLTPTQNLLTGATARTLAGLILMPMTVLKVRYESDFYAYKSLQSAARSIYAHEGVRGFFAGFGATAIRDAPYAGVYVVFYEGVKGWLNKKTVVTGQENEGHGLKMGSATINATASLLAATSATTLTNPFDAVKTRVQLQPAVYRNTLVAAKLMAFGGNVTVTNRQGVAGVTTIVVNGTWRNFFDGLALRMGRKAASSVLAWTVYEELIGRAERTFVKENEAI